MAQLIKKTAIICLKEEEFEEVTRFRHVVGINEFIHVTSLNTLSIIEGLTNVVYLGSSKDLSEFEDIRNAVNEKGVSQKWQ